MAKLDIDRRETLLIMALLTERVLQTRLDKGWRDLRDKVRDFYANNYRIKY